MNNIRPATVVIFLLYLETLPYGSKTTYSLKITIQDVYLLLHRACCYDYFFYSNSCTLLHTFKTL